MPMRPKFTLLGLAFANRIRSTNNLKREFLGTTSTTTLCPTSPTASRSETGSKSTLTRAAFATISPPCSVNISVCPSVFSTTTGLPPSSDNGTASHQPPLSTTAPGDQGTANVTGREGNHSCPNASWLLLANGTRNPAATT